MRGLTASQIVRLWDEAAAADLDGRAAAMLRVARPDDDATEPQSETLSETASRPMADALLIALRAATFGPTLEARITCAHCNASLEMSVPCATLQADPSASFAIRCEVCDQESPCAFDIREYLWREIAAAAQRALDDVHAIASIYGWSEEAILSMSAHRRRAYLARLDGSAETIDDTISSPVVDANAREDHSAAATAPAVVDDAVDQALPHVPSRSLSDGNVNGDRTTAPAVAVTVGRSPAVTATKSAPPVLPRLSPRWPVAPLSVAPSAPAIASAAEHDRIVHVSIGRLDIRATSQKSSSDTRPKSITAPPALGLAEYLQRREEGSR